MMLQLLVAADPNLVTVNSVRYADVELCSLRVTYLRDRIGKTTDHRSPIVRTVFWIASYLIQVAPLTALHSA